MEFSMEAVQETRERRMRGNGMGVGASERVIEFACLKGMSKRHEERRDATF